jgi:hypothetical protein
MSQRKQPAEKPGFAVRAVSPNIVVQAGPRTRRAPYGSEVILGVTHRTTGGYVGVLFEREEFRRFAEWLADGTPGPVETLPKWVLPVDRTGTPVYVREIAATRSQFRMIDGQTRIDVTKHGGEQTTGPLTVSCSWLGSGSGRGAVLDIAASRALTAWAAGWRGWDEAATA